MNFKKIVSLICAFSIISSFNCFAAALRTDPELKVYQYEGKRANDLFFQDFTTLELTDTGVYTAEYEIGENYSKNCLVLNDEDHSSGYGGVSKDFGIGGQSGLLGVEIRFKYTAVPNTSSTYASMSMQLIGNNNETVSRTTVGSADGKIHFNYGNSSNQQTMDNGTVIVNDTWYTAKWIIDFTSREIDFSLLNEGTGVTTQALVRGFYQADTANMLNTIRLQTQVYGGRYIYDFVRVSRESDRIEEIEPTYQKGMPVEKIPNPVAKPEEGRINITVDGVFKYPSAAPYMTEDGAVMVSAKNLAGFIGARYVRLGDTFTITKGDKVITVDAANKTAKVSGGTAAIKTMEKSGVQLFLSAEEFSKAMGYGCTIDKEQSWVKITTGDIKSEGGKNNEK